MAAALTPAVWSPFILSATDTRSDGGTAAYGDREVGDVILGLVQRSKERLQLFAPAMALKKIRLKKWLGGLLILIINKNMRHYYSKCFCMR